MRNHMVQTSLKIITLDTGGPLFKISGLGPILNSVPVMVKPAYFEKKFVPRESPSQKPHRAPNSRHFEKIYNLCVGGKF